MLQGAAPIWRPPAPPPGVVKADSVGFSVRNHEIPLNYPANGGPQPTQIGWWSAASDSPVCTRLKWGLNIDFAVPLARRWRWAILGEWKVNRRCQMRERATTNELFCTWTVVSDNSGRTHVEAHWGPAAAAEVAAAATAA